MCQPCYEQRNHQNILDQLVALLCFAIYPCKRSHMFEQSLENESFFKFVSGPWSQNYALIDKQSDLLYGIRNKVLIVILEICIWSSSISKQSDMHFYIYMYQQSYM